MKVVHVITGLGVGGAELQLWMLLRHTRHDADVVTLYNPGPVADMLREDGIHVRDLGMTRNTELGAVGRLARIMRAGRYDVAHLHLYRSIVYGRIAARLARVPVVVSTEHSIGETHLERRRMTAGVRGLYVGTEPLSDATVAVSDTVRDRLVKWGVSARKITVVPNGVDFDRVRFDPQARRRIRQELGLAPDGYVVGVLGRLDANKRFDLVIEACGPLLGPDRQLLIVGKGDEMAHLQQVAQDTGCAEHVVFAGERHDVAAMLSAMDLFVASSAQETFGVSILEALANGLPTLYTTCPALVGVDTDRARCVPGEAAALRAEVADEMRARRRSVQPVAAVQELYGMHAVTGALDELYEQLLPLRRAVRIPAQRQPHGVETRVRTAELSRPAVEEGEA